MAILRFVRGSNILENNMVQTQASAAGTLSSIIFILPALVMIGHWQGFPFWQTAGICTIGGILGVMYTIPLRRAMVVLTDLPYPEGMAAAEILRVGSPDENAPPPQPVAGDRAEPGLRDIVLGGVVAGAVNLSAGSGLQLIADEASWWLPIGGSVFRLSTGFSLALLGAGYLCGIMVGIAMLVGVTIAWGIAVPILTAQATLPPDTSIAAFATGIWAHQVRFIGAGTIAIAAIWTLIILLRPLIEGVRSAIATVVQIRAGQADAIPRTERDIPIHWVAGISLALTLPMGAIFAYFIHETGQPLGTGLFWGLVVYGVLFAFLFGFIIAAACGYMAGLVGSSNSPISGIGIIGTTFASLLLLVILGSGSGVLDTASGSKMAIALAIFVTSVVLATACIANDNLQDLKTGYLVGATPWRQQVALIVGVIVGALVIPPILDLLYNAYGFAGALPRPDMSPDQALAAPQATLMAAIAQGIFTHNLNWTMVLIGLGIGVALIIVDELLRIRGGTARLPVLAVGIGIYLPPAVTVTVAIGGILGWLTDRALKHHAAAKGIDFQSLAERPQRRGVLFSSGLIVGESLVGVVIAGIIGFTGNQAPLALVGPSYGQAAEWVGLVVFLAACYGFYRYVLAGERG
jgi:putative OPT family oligopeptide transporter